MERESDGTYIKKGPWTAEEDEVLINHVKKNGPRGWSSIRSNGLLPRTGKSCRLRWVNKLRPNLKTGCKFSAEEERVVIELQAQFGNKWAKIATFLPGRTDNDVKNFWSSRRKRLQRILQTPSSSMESPENKENNSLSHQYLNAPLCNITREKGSTFQSRNPNLAPEDFKMVPLPDLPKPKLLNLDTGLPPMVEATSVQTIPSIDFSLLPQSQWLSPLESSLGFWNRLTSLGLGTINIAQSGLLVGESKSTTNLNNSFDDLSQDMLDYFEPVSNPSGL